MAKNEQLVSYSTVSLDMHVVLTYSMTQLAANGTEREAHECNIDKYAC